MGRMEKIGRERSTWQVDIRTSIPKMGKGAQFSTLGNTYVFILYEGENQEIYNRLRSPNFSL